MTHWATICFFIKVLRQLHLHLSVEQNLSEISLLERFDQLYQDPCSEKAGGMPDSYSHKVSKGSLVRKNPQSAGQILDWIAHLCCSLPQTRRTVKYLGLIKTKVG